MTVFLLPIGRERFDLYSESSDDAADSHGAEGHPQGWTARANERWQNLVQSARRGEATSRVGRLRDSVVRRLAESIAEQRTLWALGRQIDATLVFPSGLGGDQAEAIRNRLIADARRHHALWLAVDFPLLVVSAVLAPIPGPNVIAYYLAFRVVGHLLTWRGARQAMKSIRWTLQPEPSLDELAALIEAPAADRAERLEAIGAGLHLTRLAAFVGRVAR
jgi:hypothetical protein